MSGGGYTKDEAQKFQTFTGRLKCETADEYDGKGDMPCHPVCETCLLKWISEQ